MQIESQKRQRKSIRLKEYDYTTKNLYFITICTHNHEHLFGKIIDGNIRLNDLGRIAEKEWLKTKEIRKNITIDYYVVMPNHIHGIINIIDTIQADHVESDTEHRVPTYERFGRSIPNSISTIIRSYKSAVTKKINELRKTYKKKIWQSRFYDRIIRNENELNKIRKYILNNPLKWHYDKENQNNIPVEEKRKFWKEFL